MKERKKKILDGIDKEILRVLYIRKPLVGRQIAKAVGLTASAISPRLENLRKLGIIKPVKISGMRVFSRKFGNQTIKIKSPRNIFWDLDIKKS
jgi:DNA-binding Lrp family transcriptional regulator